METGEERRLTADDRAPGQARAFVRAIVGDHPRLDDLELIASELVTNAVRHGLEPLVMAVTTAGSAATITVSNAASSSRPHLLPADPMRLLGHGLRLVDALSSHWHWQADDGRIVVQATVDGGSATR